MGSESTSPNLARSVTGLIVGALTMLSVFSGNPANLGVVDGRLADCPSSPNCKLIRLRSGLDLDE